MASENQEPPSDLPENVSNGPSDLPVTEHPNSPTENPLSHSKPSLLLMASENQEPSDLPETVNNLQSDLPVNEHPNSPSENPLSHSKPSLLLMASDNQEPVNNQESESSVNATNEESSDLPESVNNQDLPWCFVKISNRGHKIDATCNFCQKLIMSARGDRVKEHLAGIKGKISICPGVPSEVRESVLKNLKTAASKKRKRDQLAVVVQSGGPGVQDNADIQSGGPGVQDNADIQSGGPGVQDNADIQSGGPGVQDNVDIQLNEQFDHDNADIQYGSRVVLNSEDLDIPVNEDDFPNSNLAMHQDNTLINVVCELNTEDADVPKNDDVIFGPPRIV
ncbi:hypothetical protein L1987_04280 [Smallanthus sonchifolius]|uniref:Uncharacterized protein n=1 Tax=Smallanthus sonchifolius TaxID=185202 RepID=A0ACB9KCW9_9ASTR|nr:hypothetical protein L1987_04280 [Smallanthus sonchifolius]